MSIEMQKQAMKKAIGVKFRRNSERRLAIDGQPENFDTFVQDISYSQGKIESTSFRIGNGEVNAPSHKPAGSITAVFRDDEDGLISKFIKSLQKKYLTKTGRKIYPLITCSRFASIA